MSTIDRDVLSGFEKLAKADEIMRTNRFLGIEEQDAVDTYIAYIDYRVQRDLYDAGIESGAFDTITWEEFVSFIQHDKDTRNKALVVARETLIGFLGEHQFNFDTTDKKLNVDGSVMASDNKAVIYAPIFNPDLGAAYIGCILAQAEYVQYLRHSPNGGDCSWEEFLAELSTDKQLWDKILCAFCDVLRRLDFKSVWVSDKFSEMMADEKNQHFLAENGEIPA